jgi:alkaline phosphatase
MGYDRRDFLIQSTLLTVGVTAMPITTMGLMKQPLRFGLASDSHYADRAPKGTRFYRGSLDKMQEFVNVMHKESVDFVMHLGDFKDENIKQNAKDTLRYLQQIETLYSSFKGPRYHCIGNHDVDSITKQEFLAHVSNTGIAKDKSYYAFDQQGYHMVVLDPNYDSQGKDHFYAEGADWQDTNIPNAQINWLIEDLKRTNKPTFIFCHHPLFEFFRDGQKYHINNYKELQQIFEDSKKVIAVFQGHVHEERIQTINGIHYITQQGMVDYEGIENNSFSLVNITPHTIQITGFKRARNSELHY